MNAKIAYLMLLLAAVPLFFALAGCHNAKDGEILGSGKVVSIGKQKLILENKGEFLFVSLDESDLIHLRKIKKGEMITLIGKKDTDAKNADKGSQSSEVDALKLENGTLIPLGH